MAYQQSNITHSRYTCYSRDRRLFRSERVNKNETVQSIYFQRYPIILVIRRSVHPDALWKDELLGRTIDTPLRMAHVSPLQRLGSSSLNLPRHDCNEHPPASSWRCPKDDAGCCSSLSPLRAPVHHISGSSLFHACNVISRLQFVVMDNAEIPGDNGHFRG